MPKSSLRTEKLAALFLLGVLMFSPPLIAIFDAGVTISGIPLLYIYLFCAWAFCIGLAAWIIARSRRRTN